MSTVSNRVDELLDGAKRARRTLVSPEGVALDIRIASHGERLVAFILDITFMFVAILVLFYIGMALVFLHSSTSIGATLIAFLFFVVRTCYFLHFELAWQGRTPGKRICNLRVINRRGGELASSAVIARNLTREIEFFIPLSILFSLDASLGFWRQATLLAWVALIASLPLWNRDHLRAGDLVAGTQVIAMPKRVLLQDLTVDRLPRAEGRHAFTHQQLAKYGAFELQVLEELLRRPDGPETRNLLSDVCEKICRKIEWGEVVPPGEVREFLTDFYRAERADLERGQLFGRLREDKTAGESDHSSRQPR